MNTDHDLIHQLSLASHELRGQLPPATLLPAIHVRLDCARKQVRERRFAWVGWAGLSTGAVALAAALVVNAMLPAARPAQVALDADGFVSLVSRDEWQRAQADTGRTWLVETELPQARLAALGLPYDPARAGERVPAQLLMHSSGNVIAVRLNR
jgi:hypothetical protein